MVSATHNNVTPAKLEEFEATFKHFDKDDTNVSRAAGRMALMKQTLMLWEMHSALASLGIVYAVRQRAEVYLEESDGSRMRRSRRCTHSSRGTLAWSHTRRGWRYS